MVSLTEKSRHVFPKWFEKLDLSKKKFFLKIYIKFSKKYEKSKKLFLYGGKKLLKILNIILGLQISREKINFIITIKNDELNERGYPKVVEKFERFCQNWE